MQLIISNISSIQHSQNQTQKPQLQIPKLNQPLSTLNQSTIILDQLSSTFDQSIITIDQSQSDLSQKLITTTNNKSTNFQASINLFKSFIGSGILGLPFAFHKAGILLSSITMVLFLFLMLYSSKLLFLIFDDYGKPQMNLAELFDKIMGTNVTRIYYSFVIMLQIGVCASCIIFFTQFFQIVFNLSDDPNSRYWIFLLSLFFLLPLIMINNFHFFQSYSKIASLLTIATLIAVIQYACQLISTTDIQTNQHNLFELANLAGFLGIAVYSFEAIGTMFYVKQSMQNPQQFEPIFYIVSILICILMILFSTLASIAWSDNLNQIILIGLEKQQKYFLIFQSMYSINLIFSYPLQFYPIIDRINQLHIRSKYKYSIRILTTILIALFALIVPKFSTMLNLTGAIAGNTLQYIFPIYAYHRYFQKQVSTWTLVFNLLVVTLVTICSMFSIHSTIKQLF